MNWRVLSVMTFVNAVIVAAVFVHAYQEPFHAPAVGPSFGKATSIALSTGLWVGILLPLANAMCGAFALAAGLRQPKAAGVQRERILAIAGALLAAALLSLGLTIAAGTIVYAISPS